MEDDDFSSAGPPPDPSLRSWRHPSEMAANNASSVPAAQSTASSTNSFGRLLSVTTIAMIGFCVCGVALIAITSGASNEKSLTNSPSSEVVMAADKAASGALDSTGLAHPTSNPVVVHGSLTTPVEIPLTTNPTNTPNSESSSASKPVSPSTSSQSGSGVSHPDAEVVPGPEDVASALLADKGIGGTGIRQGILSLSAEPDEPPIANALVVDGLVLTSASSLGTHDHVYSRQESGWFVLSVHASDPHSDIAVLRVEANGPTLSPVVTAPTGPAAAAGQQVLVLMGDANSTSVRVGEVVATANRSTTSDGYVVVDALLTTCRNNGPSGGAALVDTEGMALGIVLNSDDLLATALPLTRAIQVGHSLTEEGQRGGAWLGVSGLTVDEGFLLKGVDPKGPAAVAGLRTNDLITRIDGHPVADWAQLLHSLLILNKGDIIEVELVRDFHLESHREPSDWQALVIEIEFTAKQIS